MEEPYKPRINLQSYLSALRGDYVQSALTNHMVPSAFVARCIEGGVIDCHDKALLSELERSIGQTIRPAKRPDFDAAEAARTAPPSQQGQRMVSTAGIPVVGGVPPFLDKSISSPQEMLRRSVADMDARIASNTILSHKDFNTSIVFNARRVWCTPELMRTLVRDPGYIDKLRAVMYPVLVSYSERVFEDGGRWYLVPYITVLKGFSLDGTRSYKKGEDEGDFDYKGRFRESDTFFLNHKGGIGRMNSDYLHLYDPADFASPDAVRRYMGELRGIVERKIKSGIVRDVQKEYKAKLKKIMDYLEPYASGKEPIGSPETLMKQFAKFHKNEMLGCDTENDFVNVKTGARFYATIRNDVKESRLYGNGWHKVLDITNCMVGATLDRSRIVGELERQKPGSSERDKNVADVCLRRLHDRMVNTEGLRDGIINGWGWEEVDGAAEYEAELDANYNR